jgi:hypothetical protein
VHMRADIPETFVVYTRRPSTGTAVRENRSNRSRDERDFSEEFHLLGGFERIEVFDVLGGYERTPPTRATVVAQDDAAVRPLMQERGVGLNSAKALTEGTIGHAQAYPRGTVLRWGYGLTLRPTKSTQRRRLRTRCTRADRRDHAPGQSC